MGILDRLQQSADAENRRVILELLEKGDSSASILDLGCNDGSFTLEIGKRIGTANLYGIEVVEEFIQQCETKGIKTYSADLNEPIPLDGETFDVIVANQVLEHLHHTDLFIKEIHRVLRQGGYATISTPNLAALYNIMFLILGQQPLTAFVSDEVYEVGNRFGSKHGVKREVPHPGHLRLFTISALKELFQYHGFEVEKIVGVGYYPFPLRIARVVSHIDPRHAVYLTMKVRKSCA